MPFLFRQTFKRLVQRAVAWTNAVSGNGDERTAVPAEPLDLLSDALSGRSGDDGARTDIGFFGGRKDHQPRRDGATWQPIKKQGSQASEPTEPGYDRGEENAGASVAANPAPVETDSLLPIQPASLPQPEGEPSPRAAIVERDLGAQPPALTIFKPDPEPVAPPTVPGIRYILPEPTKEKSHTTTDPEPELQDDPEPSPAFLAIHVLEGVLVAPIKRLSTVAGMPEGVGSRVRGELEICQNASRTAVRMLQIRALKKRGISISPVVRCENIIEDVGIEATPKVLAAISILTKMGFGSYFQNPNEYGRVRETLRRLSEREWLYR